MDRLSGGGCALLVRNHGCVVDPLDDAVDAVGGQGAQSVLFRGPAGGTSAAGRQDGRRTPSTSRPALRASADG